MALRILAIIALLIVLTKESTALTCDLSFNATCYRYEQNQYQWTSAESNCITWGGHLVSIHSKEENTKVKNLSPSYNVWIGMTDSETERVWKWTDGSNVTYQKFTSYPPSSSSYDCAYMNTNGYWYHYICNYYYYYYYRMRSVCSQPIPLPSEPRALVLIQATSTSLTVQWEVPISHTNFLTHYTISIMGQQMDTVMRNFSIVTDSVNTQTYGLYGLQEANLYTISVYAHSEGGQGRPVTIMNVQTLEAAPSSAPTLTGAFSSPTQIQLTWSAPPLADRNGILTNYSISYSGSLLDTSTRVVVRDASLPRLLILTGLEEYTQYLVRISVSTRVGTSPAGTSLITTAADAPSAAVTNHTVTTLTSTQLFVTWSPPPLRDRNGVLSYKISYRASGTSSYTTGGVTATVSFSLSGLEEGYTYDVMVTAVSIGKEGPPSVVSATTLTDVPALSAQNFALSSSTKRSLTVAWDPPNAEDHNGVLTRYVLVYAGAELDQLERLVSLNTSDSGFTTSYTADNLEEDTAYSFSIIAYTVVGSGPALTITELKTQPDAPSAAPKDISLVAVSANSIRVTFSQIALIDRNGPISHYTVYYRGTKLQPELKQIILVSAGSEQLIEYLEEDSEYSVSVSGSTQVGEGPTSTAVNVTTFTSTPSAPVSGLNATTLSAGSILVEWDELLYKERNGELLGYHVVYWRNAEDSRIHTEVVPSLAETGRVSVELFRLQPYTSYSIQVAAANSDGTGEFSAIPSVYTHEDYPAMQISYTTGSSSGPHTATLTWTKPNCDNETQISNTRYNVTYVHTDLTNVEHTQYMFATDNFLTVDNLLPYTEYTFTVAAFTGTGIGSVGPQAVVTTHIKSPSTPPISVTLQTANRSSILVTCVPPAAERQNGPLQAYSVFYQGNGFDRVMRETVFELSEPVYPDSAVRSFYLSDLMDYERYTVMVRVSTSAGYSEYTTASYVRTVEAAPTDVPEDVLSLSINSTCVRVEWNAPPVTSQRGVITSYTIMYHGVHRDTTEQSVTIEVPPVFPNTRHQFYMLCGLMEDSIYLVRLQCSNAEGSSGYSLAVKARSMEAAPSAAPTNLQHTSHTPYIATITWEAPGEEDRNGVIRHYSLELTEEGVSTSQTLVAASLSYSLSPLKAYTNYTVAVAAVTAEGQGPSATLLFTTMQDVPSQGVSALQLTDTTATSLSLSWLAPPPSQRRGLLVEYLLTWYGFRVDTAAHSARVALGDAESVREHTIEGLEEATNYTVEVVVVGEEGEGPSIQITHMSTDPIAPSSPVVSLELVSVTSRYCIISWLPPPLRERNGALGDYRVYINSSLGSLQFDSERTSYRIEDLNEHTLYSVYVASTNSEGEGPAALISVTTLKNVPSGAPLDFRVSDISTTGLTAHWSPPALADHNGVLQEYLLSYVGERTDTAVRSVRVAVAPGQAAAEQSYRLEGLEEYTNYSLELSVLNDLGESPVVRIQSVETLSAVPSLPVSGLTLESVSPRSALVSWSSPVASSLNGAGLHYRVHMSDGSLHRDRRDGAGTELYTERQHAMLTGLSPNSLYSLTVQPANSEGMGPASTMDINTMEDVPSAAVQNVTISDVTSTSLTVSWEDPPLAEQNGDIILYSILVSAVNSSYTRSVTSKGTTVDITGLHPNYKYTVCVTPEITSGPGVASDPILFSTLQSLPSAPVNNFQIIQINSTTVLLTWYPLARELRNGDITLYSLSYSSHFLKQTFNLKTDQYFFYINSLNATDGYTFTLRPHNSLGAGPLVVETVTKLPDTVVASQVSGKDLGFTFTGLILLGIVLLLAVVIVVCVVVRVNKRRGKKYTTRMMDRNIALRDIEVNPNFRSEDIYTGMPPVRERRAPTYANYSERRDSMLKLELNAAPEVPGKSEEFYDTLPRHTTFANKGCEVETETYGNLDDIDVTDA